MTLDDILNVIRDELLSNARERDRLQREADALRVTALVLARRGKSPQEAEEPQKSTRTDTSGEDILEVCLKEFGQSRGEFGVMEAARWIVETGKTSVPLEKLRYRLRYRLEKNLCFTKARRGRYRYVLDGAPETGQARNGHENCDDGDDCDILIDLVGRL